MEYVVIFCKALVIASIATLVIMGSAAFMSAIVTNIFGIDPETDESCKYEPQDMETDDDE